MKATEKLAKWQLFSCFLLEGKKTLRNAHLKGSQALQLHLEDVLPGIKTGIKMERENPLLLHYLLDYT